MKRLRWRLGLLGLLSAVLCASLRAEDTEQALLGKRLRLTMRDAPQHSSSIVGTVVSETDRTLQVDTGERDKVLVPRRAIASVEISQAPSRKGHGALIGFLVGAVAGAGLGYAIGDDSGGQTFCTFEACGTLGPFGPSRAQGALLGGLLFGGLGAGLGALASSGERWEQVPLGTVHAHAGVVAVRGGLGARLSLSF